MSPASRFAERPNRPFQDKNFQKAYDSAMMVTSFCYYQFLLEKLSLTKKGQL